MTNFSNLSNYGDDSSDGLSSFWWILRGVIATITVLGNLLVILLILTQSSLRKTQNWFVLSLGVADFLVGAVLFPLHFVFEVLYHHRPNADHFVNFTHDFILYASMTNLCSLTLDRYLSIIHPMKHMFLKKKRNIVKTIATAWMLAFMFSFGDFIIHMCVKRTDTIAKGYHIFLLLSFIAFPCVSLPVAYFRILYFVRLHQSRIKTQTIQLQHNYNLSKETERNKKNKRMIQVLGGIIGFFVISYLVLIYRAWLRYVLAVSSIDMTLSKVSFLILHSNSAINVFFYGIFKKDFRDAIGNLFCIYFHRGKYGVKFKDLASEGRRTTEI